LDIRISLLGLIAILICATTQCLLAVCFNDILRWESNLTQVCQGDSNCYSPCVYIYRLFATRVSQLKIWHFCIIGIERNVCRCTFNRFSVITQFAKLATGEQMCHRCTHRKLLNFKTFKSLSWKITYFELWHCCCKRAIYSYASLLL